MEGNESDQNIEELSESFVDLSSDKSTEVLTESFVDISNDLRTDENLSIVEQEPKNEAHNLCKRRKIEKIEETVTDPFENIPNDLNFQKENLTMVEQVAKDEAINLYRKLCSLHQSSNSDISTITKEMEKEMHDVLCKYKDETRKKEQLRISKARNNALAHYITAMNDLMTDESQQVIGYLPEVILKAGHEQSRRTALKHYQDVTKSDSRLTMDANINEFEKILKEKLDKYSKVNKKKEESTLLNAKLKCISEHLNRLNNFVEAIDQEHLLVNTLRIHQKTIKNDILDLYKKITLCNDKSSAKVKEMKKEIENAVDNKFQQFVYEYEKQEIASLKHKCLGRYHKDINRISGVEGVPFISEASLQSAHRRIEDEIVQHFKKQFIFEDVLSHEAKTGLDEIKKEMKKIFENKVKDNLEEEKLCVMEAKLTSSFKYITTMNCIINDSNDDYIPNNKLREKHEEAKEVALQFYRDANHFDKHHPSQIASDTLKELEDNELESKLKEYEEENVLHQKSILYRIKSDAMNEYKEVLKSNANRNKQDNNVSYDTQVQASEKSIKLFEEKSFYKIDPTEQTEIMKMELKKEMQNYLQERMHHEYIMNPVSSLKMKTIPIKNRSEDANLIMKNIRNNEHNKEKSEEYEDTLPNEPISSEYNPLGDEIESILEKFPFVTVEIIKITLKDYKGNMKRVAKALIDMGHKPQDGEDIEESDEMSVEESDDNNEEEFMEDNSIHDQDEPSDYDVIKLASNGLALQGVLVKRDSDDLTLSRHLLEIPNNLILRKSNMTVRECSERFFSKVDEDKFKRNLETLGYSATVLQKYIGACKSLNSQGQSGLDGTADEFSYTVFPIKSYYADVENMHMTKEAIKALQAIEAISKVPNEKCVIQKECEEFFSEFGSHVCTGHINFGTILWNNNSNHKTKGLSSSKFLKKNWSVVDRGFSFQGIWYILEKHKYYFQNHKQLEITLRNCWIQYSGMNEEQAMVGHKHISLEEISQLVDEAIRDAEFSQNCKRYIEAVLEEVKEIVVAFKNPLISKNKISEFLLYVLKNIGNYDDSDIINIKSLLKQLLYYLGNGQFKGKEDVLQWIKGSVIPNVSHIALEVSDFFYFESMVDEYVISVLDICEDNAKDDGKILSATRDLLFCAKHQECMLKQCGDYFGILLLKILFLPLNYNDINKSFDSPLSKKILQSFITNIKEKSSQLIKVKEDGVKSIEAYLLQTLIDIWQEDNQTSEKEEYYSQIIEKNKNIFSSETKNLLDEHGNLPINWKKLESAVQSIRYGMSLSNVDCDIIGTGLLDLIESTVNTEALTDDHHDEDQTIMPVKCEVLEKLGLIPYYPGKIELKDIMLNSSERLDTLTDIPWFVFHKLLMLDYKGRNSMKFPTDGNLGRKISGKSDATNEEVLMDIFSEIDEVSVEEKSSLAPMDVVVALYLCSSSFLKQTLAEKLFMCRLSIPLILPDIMDNRPTYLLWSLRNVIAEFELSKDKVIENSVVSHPFPIVSFIRLGELARSKSKLLNDLISNQAHSVFFHRDCDNSMIHQDLSGGLVDVAWFLSSIKQDQSFKESIAFMNLHGDGNKYTEQYQFLCKISNLMSVMVDVEDLSNVEIISTLQNIVKNDTQVLYIFTKKSDKFTLKQSQEAITKCFKEIGAEKINKNNVILDFTKSGARTASEMKIETANKICTCLIGKGGITLESCKTIIGNDNLKLRVDENDLNCVKGHKIALQVLEHVREENLIDTKNNMLPLQGDLWIKWGRLEKKEHRKDGTAHFSPEHYAAQLHEKKKALRREQLVICNNPPKLMRAFMTYLLRSQGRTRLFFLKWLKIYLDCISRRTLPGIHKEYSKQWNDIQNYKSEKKRTNDTYIKEMQSKLGNFEEKLVQTSFGVEHLMREIGQVYEAVSNLSDRVAPKLKEDIHKLPKVVAELLLSGLAVELMDGDSAHVPHSWVSAVFSKLQEIIGDKKLFVLSVLGVQSSGKSTLLNTMFGLQFAVSAGRCTRGVYAQLVPVVKDSDNGYDFILVVDTEGLRAPELGSAKHQHDNELATLVIGVGDLTILNIKGENPAEMQDVLQICVHAFLRLHQVNKNIRLQPSCIFIHQNVGSVNAKQKMMFAQKKLKESLDKMTQAAADQEDVIGINSFGQVINFDVEKNVYYFSDLWQGDPPMAPVNPGYSNKVNEVKIDLLYSIMRNMNSNVTISKMSLRISDLWKGILAEDFVFSFRNSLEIKAYSSLESKYASLSWTLQNNADKWFSTLRMKIQGTESNLGNLETQLLPECNSHISDLYDKTHKELVDFFENNEERELLEQWKEKRLIKLNVLKEDIIMMIRKDCMNEITIRKSTVLEQVELRKHKESIKSKARDLAIQLQGSGISPRELNNKFDNLWMELLDKLPGRRIDDERMNVEGKVSQMVYDKFENQHQHLNKEWKKYLNKPKIKSLKSEYPEITHEHLEVKKKRFGDYMPSSVQNWNLVSCSFPECQQNALGCIRDLAEKIDEYMENAKGSNFKVTQADAIIKMVIAMIEDVNKNKHAEFKFKPKFKISLVVHVCQYVIPKFKVMHEEYMNKIDPRVHLEKDREELFTFFKNIFEKSEQEKMAADMLTYKLKNPLKNSIEDSIGRKIVDGTRNHLQCLHTKGELLKKVLEELQEENNFEEYDLFITDTKCCLKRRIQKYANLLLFDMQDDENTNYARVACAVLVSEISSIKDAIVSTTNKVAEQLHQIPKNNVDKKILKDWTEIFHEEIQGKLAITKEDLLEISRECIGDLRFFSDTVSNNITDLESKLDSAYKTKRNIDFSQQYVDAFNRLVIKSVGCCERCPFCGTPCSLTDPDHEEEMKHSALGHCPQGIIGALHYDSKLIIENCNTEISGNNTFSDAKTNWQQHKYSNYQAVYPNWDIPGDATKDASLYWKWFMAKFSQDLVMRFGAEMPNIPEAWRKISLEEAKQSLE